VGGVASADTSADGGVELSDASSDASPDAIIMCGTPSCVNSVYITATLRVPAKELAKARVYLSIGPEHLELGRPRPVARPSDRVLLWQDRPGSDGAWSFVQQSVTAEGPSKSTLAISMGIPHDLAVDNLLYSLKVVAAAGPVLLDVSRTMRVDVPPDFDPVCMKCKHVEMHLNEQSRSGITCDSNRCESGLELHLEAREMSHLDGATAEVCTNGTCVRSDPLPIAFGRWNKVSTLAALHHSGGDIEFHLLSGSNIDFTWGPQEELRIWWPRNSAVLVDGDHYTVTFYKDSRILGSFEHKVRYWSMYPNGQDCDMMPCRRAILHARL